MVLNAKSISRRGFIAGTVAMLPLVGLRAGEPEPEFAINQNNVVPGIFLLDRVEADEVKHYRYTDIYLAKLHGTAGIGVKTILCNGVHYATDGFTTSIPDTVVILDGKSKKVIGFQIMDSGSFIVHNRGKDVTVNKYQLGLWDALAGFTNLQVA